MGDIPRISRSYAIEAVKITPNQSGERERKHNPDSEQEPATDEVELTLKVDAEPEPVIHLPFQNPDPEPGLDISA